MLTPRTEAWENVQSLSPEALAAHPLVIYNEDFALSRQLMALFTCHDVKPRIAVRSGQWDFLAAMVQAVSAWPYCRNRSANVSTRRIFAGYRCRVSCTGNWG